MLDVSSVAHFDTGHRHSRAWMVLLTAPRHPPNGRVVLGERAAAVYAIATYSSKVQQPHRPRPTPNRHGCLDLRQRGRPAR